MAGAAARLSLKDLAVWARRQGSAPVNLDREMQYLKVAAVAEVKDRFSRGAAPDGTPWAALKHPRPSGGGKPLRDKGLLMASVSASVAGLELTEGSHHESAALHQYGGVIRPTTARALAIPLTVEAARYDTPRAFPRTLHVQSRQAGKGALVDGSGKAQYALVQQVTVQARPFIGFSAALLAKADRVLSEALARHAVRGLG